MRALRDPFLLVLIVISLLLGSSVLTRGHEWGDDWASYVMQAQSILNGSPAAFVQHNAFTISQSSFQIGPVAYPWGYPLLLTPALLLKGLHPLTLKLPGLLLFAGFLAALYGLARDRLTRLDSLLLVALFACHPMLIQFLDKIVSDVPLLFFSTLALALMLQPQNSAPSWKPAVLGAVLFGAFFVRTTGLSLLASYLLSQALLFLQAPERRGRLSQNTAVVSLVFAGLWFGTSWVLPNGQGSYFEQLKGLTPAIVQTNLHDYFYLLGAFFGTGPIWRYVYDALVILFLIGAVTRFRADQPLVLFFAIYFVALLFWPEWQGIRFLFPLLPVFVYLVFQGVRFGLERLPANRSALARAAVYGLWGLLAASYLFASTQLAYWNLREGRKINGPFDPYSQAVYNYLLENTSPASVVVFWKPRAMRLFIQRDTFMSTECERLPLGDYVVISKKAENSQVPPAEIGQCGLQLKTVFENQRFIIYEVPKQGTGRPFEKE